MIGAKGRQVRLTLVGLLLYGAVWLAVPDCTEADELVRYAGELRESGGLAMGDYTLQFALFDDPNPSLGRALDFDLPERTVRIENGQLDVEVDLRGVDWVGPAWLEARLRHADQPGSPFVPLLPRRALRVQATGFELIDGANCDVNGDVTVLGNIGVGGSPTAKLSVAGTDGIVRIDGTGRLLEFTGPGDIRINASSGASNLRLRVAGDDRVMVNAAGNVGIGTTAPQSRLDVHGALRVNSAAGFFQVNIPAGVADSRCATACANQDAAQGFDADSGSCVQGWNANSAPVGCGGTQATRCLCVGAQ